MASGNKKICARCGELLPLDAFHKNRHRPEGKHYYCKSCMKLEADEAYSKHKIRIRERQAQSRKTPTGWASHAICHARANAKNKNIPFTITQKDVLDKVPADRRCPVLGCVLTFGGARNDNTANLDKIFPNLGYVPENIRVISDLANRIKSNATAEDILKVGLDLQKLERKALYGVG